ncbi:hypothetical protein GCK72_019170 [Caenorhabditis remanei]|uniref:Uncharacterized protein n=1 Tax=Caenorhabditis remanei TaxID=31234 RepID=A0A6A5GDA2_CAERE|nr:hypothetical protein GCK72_019170 [Caenorhabditis remanei]KAF1752615.1 hypothetical protein GCK72_019170 [Caenorhabditis remanei]
MGAECSKFIRDLCSTIFCCCRKRKRSDLTILPPVPRHPDPYNLSTQQYYSTNNRFQDNDFQRQMAENRQRFDQRMDDVRRQVGLPTSGFSADLESQNYQIGREERERREEAEHQKRLEKIRAESREKRERIRRLNDESEREENRRLRMERELQNDRVQEMIERAREDNKRKNREMENETEREIKRIREEGKFDNEEHEREKERLQLRSRLVDDRIQNNDLNFRRENIEREQELQRAQDEQNKRRRKIDNDFERKRERMYEEAERRRTEMNRQFEEIQKMMLRKVWNEIIERNWTNRLNSLRNANNDSKRLVSRCLRATPNPSDVEEWKEVLKTLRRTMHDESSNLSQMYSNTGKSFLIDIKDSVNLVSQKCDALLGALHNGENASHLRQLSNEVDRSCMSIPTLAELKNNYYTEMRNNSSL